MGRLPCCDKMRVKKGPWTPEEDILLVSYIQEHGPRNWKSVPNHTGLLRCSKSCRLRWANYLRPGIRRGDFTEQEEKMIIHLQALLGNRWAAMASYLPQRTDNDIKNYWNTYLKKKLRKLQTAADISSPTNSTSRDRWERRLQADIQTTRQALSDALSRGKSDLLSELKHDIDAVKKPVQVPVYASSTENIARLLREWTKKSPKPDGRTSNDGSSSESSFNDGSLSSITDALSCYKSEIEELGGLEPFLGLEPCMEPSISSEVSQSVASGETRPYLFQEETKPNLGVLDQPNVTLSSCRKWLYDDGADSLCGRSDFHLSEHLLEFFSS
ncbi:hypothetical protein SAY87_007945 [Trapa incisa]|uniref:Uncharacterized protein n=1 Tax=Trapa incisa TaxID=236973 RepID=A0AAN7KCE9_9MYRT|nr:hypothetical protein SAY87_007945 [Trapa incisa]